MESYSKKNIFAGVYNFYDKNNIMLLVIVDYLIPKFLKLGIIEEIKKPETEYIIIKEKLLHVATKLSELLKELDGELDGELDLENPK